MTDDELKDLVAGLSVAHEKMLASNAASKKELDLQLAKTDAQLARTNKQLAKTDAQLKKTNQKLDRLYDLVGSINNNQEDFPEKFFYRNSTKNQYDTYFDAELRDLVGNISNNQGDITEEFFYRSFSKNPNLGNIHFDSVSRNLNNKIGDLEDEYDLVLTNGDTLAIIEVKSKAHVLDLEKLVNKKIPNFSKLFRVYQNYHCYAGIATLVTNPELIAKAQELGLFLVTQQGDHASIVQTGRLLH